MGDDDLRSGLQRVIDGLLIVAAHWMACRAYRQNWTLELTGASALGAFVFGIAGQLVGLYRSWRSERLGRELRQAVFAWVVVVVPTLILFGFSSKTSAHYSRVTSFGWFLLAPQFLCGWRMLARAVISHQRAQGRNLKRVAILGATASSESLCERINERPWLGMKIVGVFDDRSEYRRHRFTRYRLSNGGTSDDMVRACRKGSIDIVYIGLPLRAELRIGEVVRELADTTVSVNLAADFFTFDLLHAHWTQLGNIPVVSIYETPCEGVTGVLKRLEDLIAGTLIVALISIPVLIVALGIKLTSKGPVFFRQRRYGLNGKEIRILKFRTMTVCEDGSQIRQASPDDERVTPFGRFLRRMSLDELPQFYQVLTGELSIVGPRPHAVAHNEQYRALIRGYMLRHKVKPGITGWAQVNGWRGETRDVARMAKRIEHDLEYIQSWTLLWDLKIILMTAIGWKKNRNAY